MGIGIRQNLPYMFVMDCEPNVEVNDFVYKQDAGVVGRALSASIATMPAIGYVIKKVGTKAYITRQVVEKDILNIEAAKNYFISETEAGKLQDFAPNPRSGKIAQKVAEGLVDDGTYGDILIEIDNEAIIR